MGKSEKKKSRRKRRKREKRERKLKGRVVLFVREGGVKKGKKGGGQGEDGCE